MPARLLLSELPNEACVHCIDMISKPLAEMGASRHWQTWRVSGWPLRVWPCADRIPGDPVAADDRWATTPGP